MLGKLTQGGMAEVYLARQVGPANYQKLVVIKRVRPHLATDKDFVAMFVNEARLAALINHPNVVSIFDLGNEDDNWYLAMEYLDGRDMLQIGRACRQHNKAVPFDVTARIVADACAGLDHAHRLCGSDGKHLNLVHRDMSPENILITFDGSVKVLDFGIAKARDNVLRTQAGQIKGKLGYVAPEAIKGEALDARADIFAIGATLYLFLCGRPAFSGTNPMEVFEKSLQPPVPPSKLNPMVPKALEAICMKCLEQNPARRFKTAGDLRSALESHLAAARRPLGAQQLSHFMRILFPPESDPVRKRTEALIEAAPPPLEDGGAPTEAIPLAAQEAPLSDNEATAIVSEADLRSGSSRAPASVDLPASPRSGYHLRSVSLPSEVPEATMTDAPHPREAAPYATAENLPVPVEESEKTLIGLPPSSMADDDLDIDIDTDEGADLASQTALPPPQLSSEADLNPDAFLGDLGGMTAEAPALFSDSGPQFPPPPVGDEDPAFPPPADNDLGPAPGGPPGNVPMTDASIPMPAVTFPVAPDIVPAPFARRLLSFTLGLIVGTAIVAGGLYLVGDLFAAIDYLKSLLPL